MRKGVILVSGLVAGLALALPVSAQLSCIQIDKVDLKGVTLLKAETLSNRLSQFEGQCLGLGEINGVLQQVTDAYIDASYVTSRAYLPEQDLSDGVLEVRVVEGQLSRIDLNNRKNKRWERQAFPGLVGKPVNLRNVEQGLDNIRLMRTYQAEMELEPGADAGDTVLNVTAKSKRPWTFNLSSDNHGLEDADPGKSAATGKYNTSVSASYDHLLGLNETWTLAANRSASHHPLNVYSSDSNTRGYSLGVSAPFGLWNLSAKKGWSFYDTTIPGALTPIASAGWTETIDLSATRLLARDQAQKTYLDVALSRRENENSLAGVTINASSRVLTVGSLGLRHERPMFGGQFHGSVSMEQGLKAFGAEDVNARPVGQPNAQFRRYIFDAKWDRLIKVKTGRLQFKTNLHAQVSEDRLYSTQQMFLGGASSVRGTKAGVVSGNTGAYLRNDLAWTLPYVPAKAVGNLQFYGALDMGRIKAQPQFGIAGGSVTGGAIGVRTTGGKFSIDASYAKMIDVPTGLIKPKGALFLSLGMTF
ncbi:MAG: ShlB/FhaC/HecB family hemolysin secretion/activation protein [Halocynthiibacter sp.]